MRTCIALFLLAASVACAQLVSDVRGDLARNDFPAAEKRIAEYRAARGVTPEMLEAFSWLGRGALAAKRFDEALRNAAETRRLALAELEKRPLDAERRLPIALGASIEVQGHALAQQGQRAEAVSFLESELKRWYGTSIRTRIQKNINLLTLAGKPAPALQAEAWIGNQRVDARQWKGRPVLLFFWAHWCGDCKRQAPALAALQQEFRKDGLVVVAPTQHYGYVAGGEEAGRAEELAYIGKVWATQYAPLGDIAVPVSEENFKNYGASTTPTLILLNRAGVVSLYHPGHMTPAELKARMAEALSSKKPDSD